MMIRKNSLSLAVAFALATVASAQDSVSRTGLTLPGDALDPWDTSEQQAAYVVDMSPFFSSWGYCYGAAPVAKTSKSSSTFSSSVMSANGTSALIKTGASYASSSYSFWQGAGFGVNQNALINNAPGTISSAGLETPNQAYVGFAEFGTTDSGETYGGIITAALNWEPSNPNRLYVTRTMLASNMLTDLGPKNASPAFGTIDEDGVAHCRADDFGASGGSAIVGINYFRVDERLRGTNTQNIIDVTGITETGEWLVVNESVQHTTPTAVPTSIDGNPHIIGTNFDGELVVECGIQNPLPTFDHLGAASDHRGSASWSSADGFPGSSGTLGLIGKDAANDSRAILVTAVDGCGDVVSTMRATPPAAITDLSNGYIVNTLGESIHHVSQTAFNGGTGQVAVGEAPNGTVLAAMTIAIDNGTGLGNANPDGAIIVANINPATSTVIGWTVAAYVDGANGKPYLNGPGGTARGRLTRLLNATGGAVTGPSLSAPSMDSAGNIWFIAAVEHFNRPTDQFDSALMRAVLNPKTGGYELEKVLELGQILNGKNSKRRYSISFMGIADSNSVASSTIFSGATIQDGYNGLTISNPRNPRALGGLVISVEVTYDVDRDGNFNPGGGVDEDYNVALYISPYKGRIGAVNTPDLQDGGTKSL